MKENDNFMLQAYNSKDKFFLVKEFSNNNLTDFLV